MARKIPNDTSFLQTLQVAGLSTLTGGLKALQDLVSGVILKANGAQFAAAVPGTDYSIPNTRAYWFSTAVTKLGTTNLADMFFDWETAAGWTLTTTGTGICSPAQALGQAGALTGVTGAGVGSARAGISGYHVPHLRTSRWLVAARYSLAFIDANHQAFFGLNGTATPNNRVGIGFDGAASVAKCYAGVFSGVLPASPRAAASVISTKAPSASMTVAYIYNDVASGNIKASLDGEAEFIACAVADIPSEPAYWMPILINSIAGVTSRAHQADWSFLAVERAA